MKNKTKLIMFLAIVSLAAWAQAQTLGLVVTSPTGSLTQLTPYTVSLNYYCSFGQLDAGATVTYTAGFVSGSFNVGSCLCQLSTPCGSTSFLITPPVGSNSLVITMSGTVTSLVGTVPVSDSVTMPVIGSAATCNGNSVCDEGETQAACGPTECRCGDGTCAFWDGETPATCSDCGAAATCNFNFNCDPGETFASCPNDCWCNGDGISCDPSHGENAANCPTDCPVCNFNFNCDPGETFASCPNDCWCNGDGISCDPSHGENAANCPTDCGGTTSSCGDGVCNFIPFESPLTCPADCPVNGIITCGDHVCTDAYETVASCPTDCRTNSSGVPLTPIDECGVEFWYDEVDGSFQGWQVKVAGGTPPYTFVWECDKNNNNYADIIDVTAPANPDYDFWFEWRLPQEYKPADCDYVFVKVTDNRSDTQILEKELIYPELASIVSTLSTDCPDVYTIPDQLSTGTYYYGIPVTLLPYRSTDPRNLGHWRLFEKDTTWVKILGITPLLVDTRYNQEWTRTSPDFPGDPNGMTHMLYVVGGCERTSASVLGGNGGLPYVAPTSPVMEPGLPKAQYYWHPDLDTGVLSGGIDDEFTITIETAPGVSTTETVYSKIEGSSNVRIRSLLPFPPADSLGWTPTPIWMPYPNLLHFNPFKGARYSSYTYPFKLPDSAEYLRISVEYTCYDRYLRYGGDLGYSIITPDPLNPVTWYLQYAQEWRPCTIDDTSKVWTSYMIPENQISKSDLSEIKIDVSGYYDVKVNNLTGVEEVTGGYIHMNMSPDEFAGVLLHVNPLSAAEKIPSSKYQHLSYPVRHRLLKKWKPTYFGAPLQRFYYAEDNYGYEDPEFGYDGRCDLPACKGNCVCAPNDPLNPTCTDTTNPASPVSYKPNIDAVIDNDCRCKAADSCVVDICNPPNASKRTFHEFEQTYFDFTEFYTRELKPKENYLSHYPDMDNQKSITIDRVESSIEDSWLTPPAAGPSCTTDFDESPNHPYRSDTCTLPIIWPNFRVLLQTSGIDGQVGQATLNGQVIATTAEFGPYEVFTPYLTKDVTYAAQMGDNIYHVYSDDSPPVGTDDAAVKTTIWVEYDDAAKYDIIQDFYFSAVNIEPDEFRNLANFSVYTHFRRKDFMLGQGSPSLLVERDCTQISWTATGEDGYTLSGVGNTPTGPASGELHSGNEIEVTFDLEGCSGGSTPSTPQDVEILVPGYENGLTGVWWNNKGQAFVTTSGGSGTFRFTLGNAPASVSMDYEGGYDKTIPEGYLPSTASFVLGITEVSSPFASVEFFLLLLILFLLLFFWRWFRRGRMDYEGMLQELQGEPSE